MTLSGSVIAVITWATNQFLPERFHLGRCVLYLFSTFVSLARQKSAVTLQQQAGVGLDHGGRRARLVGENRGQP